MHNKRPFIRHPKFLKIATLISFFVLTCVVCWLFITVYRAQAPHGLHGAYYSDTQWQIPWKSGILDVEISDKAKDFWRAVQYLDNRFSIEWQGYIEISETADYNFYISTNGSSQLTIDDAIVIDHSDASAVDREKQGTVFLSRGFHPIAIRHRQTEGEAVLRVDWANKEYAIRQPLSADVLAPPSLSKFHVWFYSYVGKTIILTGIAVLWCWTWSLLFIGFQFKPSATRQGWGILLLACSLLIIWQSLFYLQRDRLDNSYKITAVKGITRISSFVGFYYYSGLFPLRSTLPFHSREEADAIIRNHPETLFMEHEWAISNGNLGKIWLFLPAAFLKGTAIGPTVLVTNLSLFIVALLVLLILSWCINRFILGIFLVIFLGSHPFQLYETYGNLNNGEGQVFSLPITIAILCLSLHLPFIFRTKLDSRMIWVIPVFTGILLATAKQVRTENIPIIISAVACYGFTLEWKWPKRIALCLLLASSFIITEQIWQYYFEGKIRQTTRLVERVGGESLGDLRRTYHFFWHPIFCGLADFDTKYGYSSGGKNWDDEVGNRYAARMLGLEIVEHDQILFNGQKTYIWLVPGYEETLRKKVISDIMHDPLWYLEIQGKRILRILTEVAPARIGIGGNWLTWPLHSLLLIPTIVLLGFLRKWHFVKLLSFTLPIPAVAFLIYSGNGLTYFSLYLQILAALYWVFLWRAMQKVYHLLKS